MQLGVVDCAERRLQAGFFLGFFVKRVLLKGFVGALLGFLFLVASVPAKAENAPKLGLSKLNQNAVELSWRLPKVKRKIKSLQVYRAAEGQPLTMIAEIGRPARRGHFAEALNNSGRYTYKVKAKSKNRSRWSRPLRVDVQPASDNGTNPPPSNPGNPGTNPPSTGGGGGNPTVNLPDECSGGLAQAVVTLVNQERARLGLGALGDNSQLRSAANTHNHRMSAANDLIHTGWFDEILATGYRGRTFGQNIGYNYATASGIFSAWMQSPSHRANIVSGSYSAIGISCVRTSNGIWWTQNFGG